MLILEEYIENGLLTRIPVKEFGERERDIAHKKFEEYRIKGIITANYRDDI